MCNTPCHGQWQPQRLSQSWAPLACKHTSFLITVTVRPSYTHGNHGSVRLEFVSHHHTDPLSIILWQTSLVVCC